MLGRSIQPIVVRSPPQPIFHYGFIPLIIVLGMRTEPRPSWIQLIGPM